VQQVQQVATQVSSQINHIDTGIQDVASNLEQALKPSTQSDQYSENISGSEPATNQNQSTSSPSSRDNSQQPSDTKSSRERKQFQDSDSPSTSSTSTNSNSKGHTTGSESEGDFVHLEKPTSEEGYVDQTQSSSTNKPKSSRLDLAGRSGFGNPFGYLMGNGGLCGGRGDNKASNTSEASPLPQSNPSDQGTSRQTENFRNYLTEMSGKGSSPLNCDTCNTKFGFLTRKKSCSECKLYFCSSCIKSMASKKVPDSRYNNGSTGLLKVCARCQILLKSPPVKADLMELRVKDLQRFLMSHKISMKDCVEKKDLVELIMKESPYYGSTSANESSTKDNNRTTTPNSNNSNSRSTRNTGPVEREQANFPRSYVQSTHRQDFFDRFVADEEIETPEAQGDQSENTRPPTSSWVEDTTSDPNISPSSSSNVKGSARKETIGCDASGTQPRNQESGTGNTFTPVEKFESNSEMKDTQENESDIIEETPIEPMDVGSLPGSPIKQKHPNSNNSNYTPSKEAGIDLITQNEGVNKSGDHEDSRGTVTKDELSVEGAVGGISVGVVDDEISTPKFSPSPKRFAKQDLVYLAEIESLDELNELSVTQLKKLLAMNRVTFKGVVEKEELLKIVTRLWKQEQRAEEGKDSIKDEELCKICMDHPVDCVMLECGHMCTCTRCGKQMAECPICRQYVVRVVRTFRA